MVRGLTDKESLNAIQRESRDRRETWQRIRGLAAKGLRDPAGLTPDETRELCDATLRQPGPR